MTAAGHREQDSCWMPAANNSDYAPFLCFQGGDCPGQKITTAILRDLKNKAASLDPQWRYQKLLIEYHLSHNDPAQAGVIAKKNSAPHTQKIIS